MRSTPPTDPFPAADPFPGRGADPFPERAEGRTPRGRAKTPEIGSQALQKREDDALPERAEIPWTGEVIDLGNPEAVARALDEARAYKRERIDPLINGLERVVSVMVRTVGSATIRAGGYTLSAPAKRSYTRDLPAMKAALIQSGCPKERADEVIVETISYSATTGDLDRLAKANEDYAKIIEQHTTVEEKPRSVTVKQDKNAGS